MSRSPLRTYLGSISGKEVVLEIVFNTKNYTNTQLYEINPLVLLFNITEREGERENLLDSCSWMYEGRDSIDVSSRVDPWRRKLGKEAEWELRPDTEGGQGTGVHHGAL